MTKRDDLSQIKITDNIMFTSVFSNLKIVKKFLELLLNVNIKEIKVIQKEKAIDNVGHSRGVRFDVYLENDTTIYDIEIQTSNTYDLPKRTRYYQSKIDRKYLHKGDKSYNKLVKSFIIFICTFNPFKDSGTNQPIYVFENMCVSNNNTVIKLNDLTYKVFINSHCDVSQIQDYDIKSFIELINNGFISETRTVFIEDVINEANRLRQNGKWRNDYMSLMQECLEKQEKEYKIETTINMLQRGASDDFILGCVKNLTQEQLDEIKREIQY